MRIQFKKVDYVSKQCDIIKNNVSKLGYDITFDFSKEEPECKLMKSDKVELLRVRFQENAIACVCPTCYTEIFGYWKGIYSLNTATDFTSHEHQKHFGLTTEESKELISALSIYNYIFDVMNPEMMPMKNMKECPCCGAELSHEKGYYIEVMSNFRTAFYERSVSNEPMIDFYARYDKLNNFPTEGFSAIFDLMKIQRRECEQRNAEQKSAEFVSSCDIPVKNSVSSENLEKIRGTSSKLQEYILNLIKLETNLYSLKKRLPALYAEQSNRKRDVIAEKYSKRIEPNIRVEQATEHYLLCQEKVKEYEVGNGDLIPPIQPKPPVMLAPKWFNKKKVLAENEALKIKYQTEMSIYDEQVRLFEIEKAKRLEIARIEANEAKIELDQAKVEAENSMNSVDNIKSVSAMAKNMIDNEVEKNETLLKRLYECRNRLYGYDIIFGKYRNIVALSTFYEYLISGRCTTLVGADGAYNLYENEIRADRIIDQLSQVIESLDEIKETQYMLYSELKTVNNSLEYLNKTMDTALVSLCNMEDNIEHIAENTDVMAYNSAVTAHYSKINAELTNALGFMIAFE